MLYRVGEFGEELAHEAENDSSNNCQPKKPRRQLGKSSRAVCKRNVVGGVMDTPGCARRVAHNARDQDGNQSIVLHATHDDHLQGEYRPCERRAENRPEARCNARQEQDSPVFRSEVKQSPVAGSKAATHLERRSLPAGGTAQKVRHKGSRKHQGSHSGGNASSGFMDLLKNQVVSPFGHSADPMVD